MSMITKHLQNVYLHLITYRKLTGCIRRMVNRELFGSSLTQSQRGSCICAVFCRDYTCICHIFLMIFDLCGIAPHVAAVVATAHPRDHHLGHGMLPLRGVFRISPGVDRQQTLAIGPVRSEFLDLFFARRQAATPPHLLPSPHKIISK